MQLTKKLLDRFMGGQVEVQNQNEGYIFRGEISAISIEGSELKIRLSWMAKGEGYPPLPHKWVKDSNLDYGASLEIYSVSDIGPGTKGGNRICLSSGIVGETVILYPPDGSKLDPKKVGGLVLETKRLPFHESIVNVIRDASSTDEMELIALLIKATKIPKDHDKIIKAWSKRCEEMTWGSEDLGVSVDLLKQKHEVEEAKKKTQEAS